MLVVSGCPRSGTSLMMDLFRVALGDDRILGDKFPQLRRIESLREARDGEPERLRVARLYQFEKQNPDWEDDFAHSKKMNPNGFWEMKWTVRGIQYEPVAPDPGLVCKIVSQGLARSNPQYTDKVVMMVRHPFAVAQSQQDLVRSVPFLRADGKKVSQEEMRVLSPQMYIDVSIAVSAWFVGPGKDVPVHRINFDELIADPEPVLEGLGAFIGEGDWARAAGNINPKLRRSPQQPGAGEDWSLALSIHERLGEGDWRGVLELAEAERERRKADPPANFYCSRWGGPVTPQQCALCHADPSVRTNMRKTAERRGIDWKQEPCLWEVAYEPDRSVYLTLDESVAANHWQDQEGAAASVESVGAGAAPSGFWGRLRSRRSD